ncbi:hypothetical protein [Flavobacterium chungangense]|uniref:hypothetical protein n=2 Tax=Flavobacterium chungangense TaxID=554283 RepID=UPI0012FA09DF|nr:hypothetical protein [Flavobacterium chungangense]
MKNFNLNSLCKLLLLTFGLFISSCSKEDSSPIASGYPKNVTIVYKVISTSVASASITYKNETAGMTTLADVTLPFTKSFVRTVNKNDDASLGFSLNQAGPIKLEILVDGSSVKTQDFNTGTGAMVYLFQ